MNEFNKPFNVIVAGVGGQGAITIAQLILGAAWKAKYFVLQSEVHGMSQRGGAVNAQIIFDKSPVTGPIIGDGEGDLLIGIEPLETLRYLSMMSENSHIISSDLPLVNMSAYPDPKDVMNSLKKVNGIIVDAESCTAKLEYKHATNMCLLGAASNFLPIDASIWNIIITERFRNKGEDVIKKNIEAFEYGKKLAEE